MKFPQKVTINEVGPRDGLQNEKTILAAADKAVLINAVIDSGVKVIEVGSLAHPKKIPPLADTDKVYKMINKPDDVELRVLVPNRKGVERAAVAGMDKVKMTVSASKSHNFNNFNRTPQQTMADFKQCYRFAVDAGLRVSAAIATSFGCPFEGDVPLAAIVPIIDFFVDLGISEISLSDTTGMGNPLEVQHKCSYVRAKYPDVIWNLHFHNTRDVGHANILAAMDVGISRFDASFSGLGGCPFAPGASGNVCTEDLVHMLHEIGIETGIDLDKSISVSKKVRQLVGHPTESYMLRAGRNSDLPARNNK